MAVVLLLAPAARAAATDDFVGVSAGTLFAADGTLLPGADAQLDALGRSGIGLARVDARWDSVEPFGPGTVQPRRWAPTDRIAAALAARGVRWLPVLGYSTSWSTTIPGTDKAPPRDAQTFADYAAAVAQRYGPDGDFWTIHPELPRLPVTSVEVWNEPNLGFYWGPAADPAAYASLYLTTRAAIHSATPGVSVIIGGLSAYADAPAFLRAMFAARPDLVGAVDAVGSHPYASGAPGVMAEMANVRATLRGLGAGAVPIVVTELGWPRPNSSPTAAFALPDDTRAGTLALTVDALRASDCGVDGADVFAWSTPERDPDEQEDWFGLAHPDSTPTPALSALIAVSARAAAAPVAVCGASSAGGAPLPLSLTTSVDRRGGRTCVQATVDYSGDPVNRIPVAFRQGSYAVTVSTDDDGEVQRCFSKPGTVTAQAIAGAWAASPRARL